MKPTDSLLERLADEHALGTLRGGARRRFERWLQDRPALRDRIERTQLRLAPLASRLAPASAPTQTWSRIEQRLFGTAAAPPRRAWGWRFAALWAAFASVALLTLGGLLLFAPERLVSSETLALRTQRVPAAYIAVLSDAQGRPALVASAARHATVMDLKVLRATPPQPGAQWLLWGHTAQGERVALGPIDLANRSRIELAGTAEQALSKLATLSVSAEPAGTSPPAPTTVALLQGPCVKVW